MGHAVSGARIDCIAGPNRQSRAFCHVITVKTLALYEVRGNATKICFAATQSEALCPPYIFPAKVRAWWIASYCFDPRTARSRGCVLHSPDFPQL